VCILPGTELAFSEEVKCAPTPFGFSSWRTKTVNFRTAIFRQVNKDMPRVHHDALGFPDGTYVLLTDLREGQEATVLQFPAQPKTPAEEAAQKRDLSGFQAIHPVPLPRSCDPGRTDDPNVQISRFRFLMGEPRSR
jgi:hypothetical protein